MVPLAHLHVFTAVDKANSPSKTERGGPDNGLRMGTTSECLARSGIGGGTGRFDARDAKFN